MLSKLNKKDRKALIAGIVVLLSVFGSVGGLFGYVEYKQNQERKAKQAYKKEVALRSEWFREYLLNSVNSYAACMNNGAPVKPAEYGNKIPELVADSTQYANAIINDVPFVVQNVLYSEKDVRDFHNRTKTVRTLTPTDKGTLCKESMKCVNEYSRYFYMPFTNSLFLDENKIETPPYRIKVNLEKLKKISSDLLAARKAKNYVMTQADTRIK